MLHENGSIKLMVHYWIFIDTTDIQKVSAVALDGQHSFIVECEFIPGSDAQGCLAILIGELDNVTVNLTCARSSSSKVGTVDVANAPSSYFKVVAFDVEHDGSVATLSIPGDIIIADGLKFNKGLYTYHSSNQRLLILCLPKIWAITVNVMKSN